MVGKKQPFMTMAPLAADFEITTCYLQRLYFGLNAFWKLRAFEKWNSFWLIEKKKLLSIVKPTDWHNEINSETKMTWNLSTTSPAADVHFSVNKSLFSLSFSLLDFLCICAHHRRRKAGILPSLEDLLFYTIAEGQEKIPAHKFTTVKPHPSWPRRTRPSLPYIL